MLSKRNRKKLFLTLLSSALLFIFFALNLNFYFSSFLSKNFSYSSDYSSENSKLRYMVSELQAKVKLQQSYIDENIELKKRLGYELPKNINFLKAELVILSPFTFTSSGIINKGSSHGVKSGFIATASGKLVGKVSSVEKNYSEILFSFDPNFTIMVNIGMNKIPGILKGNGLSSYIKYVTDNQKVVVGDKVVLSSNGLERYPGIEIGEISEVKSDGGFLILNISGLIDPRNTKFLTIIAND
jgi:rod shape-determining protein MreC